MLQKMRDNTQSLGFKILVGAIIFVLAVFGFGAFNLFTNPDPEIASVNGDPITQSELGAETERARLRILGQLGENADPALLDTLELQGQALDLLINRRLMEQATDDLHLATSKARVDRSIVSNEVFQTDGTFNEGLYLQTLQRFGYTPAAFAATAAKDMAIDQLQSGVAESAVVPEWQLRWMVALMQQKRDLAYLPLTRDHFAERVTLDETAIQQHYDDNRLDYQTEESVDVAFVTLSWQDFMDEATASVDEDAIASAYEAEKTAAASDEQRRSSHILLRLNDDRDEAAAIEEAKQLRAQLNTGADFATLAEAHSGDPGSAANGGDLGAAGRGVFVPEFEEALFALEEGDISEPVVTQFGVHLIRLDEIIIPEYPTLEERRDALVQQLAEVEARALFADGQRAFDELAFEQNDTLEGVAEAFGLTVQAADGITRDVGEGAFEDAALREAAYSVDVLERGFNSLAVEQEDDTATVVRLRERHLPREQTLDEVREDIEALLRDRAARAALAEAAQNAAQRLADGEAAGAIAESYGLEWVAHTLASAGEPGVPRPVLQAAFEVAMPADGAKAVTQATLDDGGEALITVTRVENGDIETMTEQEVDALAGFLRSRTGNLDFSGFFESLRADASINRPGV